MHATIPVKVLLTHHTEQTCLPKNKTKTQKHENRKHIESGGHEYASKSAQFCCTPDGSGKGTWPGFYGIGRDLMLAFWSGRSA